MEVQVYEQYNNSTHPCNHQTPLTLTIISPLQMLFIPSTEVSVS